MSAGWTHERGDAHAGGDQPGIAGTDEINRRIKCLLRYALAIY
jgi:hypothetical protein